MDKDRMISIVQTSKHKWKILGPKGNILEDDINIASAYQAEQYIKSYVSSFLCYNYQVLPTKKGER